MIDVPNSVRRQSLRVTVDTEALALSVRQQLQELNRATLIPIIDRVFAEFDGQDTHIYIDRLDIDLGSFSSAEVAEMLPLRFERELRERLRHALTRDDAATRVEARSAESARLAAVEEYLLTGTLPFWASLRAFDVEEAMSELLAANSAAVARLFQRHRANERLVRRAVLRLGERTLGRLLHVLAPDDAALIIVYIGEIRDYHAVEPLIPASDDVVSRTLWVVALSYVLRDPGTQFNRLSLLRSLLEGLARTEQWSYQDILLLFDVALQETRRRLPVGTTLLATVMELIERERKVNPWYAGAVRSPEHRALEAGAAPADEGADLSLSPSSVPPASASLLSRYESADALRFFLRSGVLPWVFALRHPTLTPSDVTSRLPELTVSMLRSLAADLSPDEQVRSWHRATRVMSAETVVRVLKLVRDQADRPAPGRFPGPVAGPQSLLHAREIVALLYGRHETDASWWSIQAGRSLPIEISSPEADWIKSLLMARATGRGPRPPDGPSSTSLLMILVQVDAEGTRQWLRALHRASVRISPLVDEPPSTVTLQATVQALLPPESAVELTVLIETLSGLDATDLPGPVESARAVMLRAMLDRVQSGITSDLLLVILRQWFGPSLTRRVIEVLVATAGRLVETGRISISYVQALTQTLESVGELAARTEAASSEREATHGPSAAEAEAFVLAWLRRSSTSAGPAPGAWERADTLRHSLRQVIERSPAAVTRVLLESVADPRARRAWVTTLGESDLARFAGLVEPRRARVLLEAAELLFEAWTSVAPDRLSITTGRSAFWMMFLAFLGSTRDADRSIESLTQFFFAHVDLGPAGAGGARDHPLRERLLDAAARAAGNAGQAALRSILSRDLDQLRQTSVRSAASPDVLAPGPQPASPSPAPSPPPLSGRPDAGRDHQAPPPARPSDASSAAPAHGTQPPPSEPETWQPPHRGDSPPTQASDASSAAPGHGTQPPPSEPETWQPPHRGDSPPTQPSDAWSAAPGHGTQAPSPAHGTQDAALERDAPAPAQPFGTTAPAEALRPVPAQESRTGKRGRTAFGMDESDAAVAVGKPIYITNAGLVLTAPFLPRLFQTLEMLEPSDDGKSRIRPALISRAVHLLQWLVDGRTSAPEPLLCVNKLLCGVAIPTPVDAAIEPTPREIEVATALLRSIITNWPILKNTSIAGLQETFLQRDGRLERLEHGWRLFVPRRTVDVLLDHLPWSISTVVHSLMPAPIFVTW